MCGRKRRSHHNRCSCHKTHHKTHHKHIEKPENCDKYHDNCCCEEGE